MQRCRPGWPRRHSFSSSCSAAYTPTSMATCTAAYARSSWHCSAGHCVGKAGSVRALPWTVASRWRMDAWHKPISQARLPECVLSKPGRKAPRLLLLQRGDPKTAVRKPPPSVWAQRRSSLYTAKATNNLRKLQQAISEHISVSVGVNTSLLVSI